jgi:RHS repeat-associated protein
VSTVGQTDVFRTVPTASGTKTSLSEITYSGGLPGSDAEWDYGMAAGQAPPVGWNPLLLTYTTYLYATLGNNIADHLSEVTIKNGTNGSVQSQVIYAYDQSAVTASGAPQLVSVTGARGNLTTSTALISGISTLSSAYTYYDSGNVLTATDVNGGVTTYKYGSTASAGCGYSFPVEIDLPISGLSTYQTPNCTGAVIASSKDLNGNSAPYTYGDPNFWRPTKISYPDGGSTSFTYNEGTTSPWNIQTTMAKDGTTNVVSETILDGFGRTAEQELTSDSVGSDLVVTSYDANGRVSSVTNPYRTTSDPTYGITQYGYDPLNRITTITHPDSSKIQYTYTGAATQVQDEGYNTGGTSHITHVYQTDGLGRTTSTCEVSSTVLQGAAGTPAPCGLDISGTGFLTTYQYDPLGNITNVQQPGVNPRTYTYDGLSRLTQEVNPESGSTSYTYDATGQQGDLATRTRPKANQTGAAATVTTYTFDKLHRLTNKAYNDGTPSIGIYYDEASPWGKSVQNEKGRMSQTIGDGGQVGSVFNYDSMGRIVKEFECTPLNCGVGGFALSYTYDYLGNITQLVNSQEGASGTTYTYSYDTADHLTKLVSSFSDSNHPATLLTVNSSNYNALGEYTQATLGNGILRSVAYDNRGRPTSVTDGSIYSFTLGYANDTNILSGNDSVNGNWTFTYDALAHLSTSGKTGTGCNYKYDPAGNRWQQNVTAGSCPSPQYSFNSNNQITGSTIAYDAAGNMTNDGAGDTYTYDAEGRVTAMSGNNAASYVYDIFGQRVRTVVNTKTSDFIFDPSGRALDQISGSTWQRGEVFAGGSHLATYNNVVSPAMTYFEHSDWVGSVRARSNATGGSVETCTSLPFGDNQSCVGTDGSPVHFATLTLDSESNLQHAIFRQYSTTQGRWTVPDPSGLAAVDPSNPQAWNRYAYVTNRPLRFSDPTGLNLKDCVWYAGTAGCTPCPNCGAPAPPGGDSGGGGGGGGGAGDGGADCSVFSSGCPATPSGLFGGNNMYDMSVISLSGPLWAIDAAAENSWSSNLSQQIETDFLNQQLLGYGLQVEPTNPLDAPIPWWETILVGSPIVFKNPAVPAPTPLQPPGTTPAKCSTLLKQLGACPTGG